MVLSGNTGGTWSNGASTATITVSVAGDYSVTKTNSCGSVTSNHIIVTTGAVPVFVATKEGIFPVPLAARPIDGVLLTHV